MDARGPDLMQLRRLLIHSTSDPMGEWKCNSLSKIYDRQSDQPNNQRSTNQPTDQPTDQQMDRLGHKEVTLPTIQ